MAGGKASPAERMTSSHADRKLAATLAAQICAGQGETITGCRVMSFMIMFETYLSDGANKACEALGWIVEEKEVVRPFKIVDTIGRNSDAT
jgi:hypothetical protein